jgi:hypothetical protein
MLCFGESNDFPSLNKGARLKSTDPLCFGAKHSLFILGYGLLQRRGVCRLVHFRDLNSPAVAYPAFPGSEVVKTPGLLLVAKLSGNYAARVIRQGRAKK